MTERPLSLRLRDEISETERLAGVHPGSSLGLRVHHPGPVGAQLATGFVQGGVGAAWVPSAKNSGLAWEALNTLFLFGGGVQLPETFFPYIFNVYKC